MNARATLSTLISVPVRSAEEFVYVLPPIDWWEGWTPLRTLLLERRETYLDEAGDSVVEQLVDLTIRAARIFTLNGWEGDGWPDGWYVSALPTGEVGPDLLIAVKQRNNGTVYLLSPVPLPWIEEYQP